jgi:preprotein translocase subunit SecG
MLYKALIIIHVILAVGIIGLVLLQRGKGADTGAAFGGGASGTVFGSQGASSFLSRTTAVLATLFFANSLALAFMAGQLQPESSSVIERAAQEAAAETEAATPDALPLVPDSSGVDGATDAATELPTVPEEQPGADDMATEDGADTDTEPTADSGGDDADSGG